MPDLFDECYKSLEMAEGGYVEPDDDDPGGETFMGITKKNWGSATQWVWDKIDGMKKEGGTRHQIESRINALQQDPEVQTFVREFYKKYYWDRSLCSRIKYPALARAHLSIYVNVEKRGGKALQHTINSMSDTDLDVDGVLGTRSKEGVDILNDLDFDEEHVEQAVQIYRKRSLEELEIAMANNPALERRRKGLSRRYGNA